MQRLLLFLGLLVVPVMASPVAAESFRLGSPLAAPQASPGEGTAVLSFTPRVPGVINLDDARVTLSYAPFRIDDRSAAYRGVAEGFAIGGAVAVDDVVVSGGLKQTSQGFSEREDLGAAIEIGDVTTHMSYAGTEGIGGIGTSRYELGADLAAAPGVSVGAGLTYGLSDRAEDDGEAAGIVRFRLSF